MKHRVYERRYGDHYAKPMVVSAGAFGPVTPGSLYNRYISGVIVFNTTGFYVTTVMLS